MSWDVLQCSKPVAKRILHQGVKVTCMIICHEKCVANRCVHIVVISVPTVGFIQGSRVGSWDDACVVTEVSTFLSIMQVSFGLFNGIIMKCNYLHAIR